MAGVLVLYYSSYGHIETMANAMAAGVREAGAAVAVKRVPELVPAAVAAEAGYRVDQPAPVATVAELPDYDAIIIGTPTRYGTVAAQMKNFLDQTGGLFADNKLVGKVGSAFTSTGSQHGGHATTIQSVHTVMLHLGMVIVGLPYTFTGLSRMDEISGGSPFGASTVADGENHAVRQPSANELDAARFQGRHVARIAQVLAAGRVAEAT
ncbi:NAD(P)H:quinone oxidoreductase [Reyranella sp. CPCC 100927]|uniref:NAD(P)H:quinone oxidoreductase n=1 Tax=Reyranella sp. CPCC 100927 TaxID=2599616 RepID=UPI0011B4A2DC|nr:NAD(P)H:quinone oxidoreductase [Reyranella sp. CPCC 100927]TWS97069.1 NAD(P)H:quinone oxidoreductase [Reyranella sp. CPCC 100927]